MASNIMKSKTPRHKYKLNVNKGGTILANTLPQLIYRIIRKKYVITNNRRSKGPRRNFKNS